MLVVAIAVTAAAGLVSVASASPNTASPNSAAPNGPSPAPPTTASAALRQYKQLSQQADSLNEDLEQAQVDLQHKQQQLSTAKADEQRAGKAEQAAKAQQSRYQRTVDQLSDASFEGARFNQLSALLTGSSAQNFLEQASALRVLSGYDTDVLSKYQKAVTDASTAQRQASAARQRQQDATNSAAQLVDTIKQKKSALNTQIKTVTDALHKLSPTDKASLGGSGNMGQFYGPPGAANTALQAALSRRGDPYVWGAAGPDQFDCSGLMMWSYAKAGINLPHSSRAQYGFGTSVAYGQWQPGDLLFWGSSASSIHHVAMYAGDGQIVVASTSGEPVQVLPVSGGGNDYYGAKRLVG